jgi:hypothetical protein
MLCHCAGDVGPDLGGVQDAFFVYPGQGISIRLGISSRSSCLSWQWDGLPRIHVNVTWSIWGLIDSAETISDMMTEGYLVGMGKLVKGGCLVCPNDHCYESNYGSAYKSDV